MVRDLSLTAKGPGSVPGQGIKIPQALQHGQEKKKKDDSLKYLHGILSNLSRNEKSVISSL